MKNKRGFTLIEVLFILTLIMNLNSVFGATIQVVELPEIYPVSSDFQVEIDSVEIPVTDFIIYNEIQCHYARVAFEGSVTIKVIANENIIQHKIRPLRHDIQPVIEGQSLQHTLSKPQFLAYNINDKKILFLLALPLETDIPDLESDSVINIMDSGIDNTGATDETDKISLAMDQADQSDKTLYFPKGVYMMKQLEIANRNGLNIYLAAGAVLRGTGKGTDFNKWSPELKPGDKKIDHFISIKNSSNISISGRGTIDPWGTEVHKSLNGGEPIHDINEATMKIRGITTESSQNVFIDGLLIRESSSQSAPARSCDNVSITNSITINYLHLKNSGGFNLWGCTNSRVKNCFYYGGDDGLSAKATEGDDCHHLTFENSVIYTLTRGVTFGMQGEEEMHSVVFRNIDVISTRDGIDFKHNYGQGDWHNILVENITVDEIVQDKGKYGNPINLQLNEGGSIEDVTIRNVIIQDPGTPGGIYGQHVAGNRAGYISNITFINIRVGGIPWVDLASSKLTLDAYVDANSIFFSESCLACDQWSTLTSDDFESGFGNWVDGGDDVTLSSNNAIGAQCVDLQDDGGDASAIWLINNLDLSNSSQLKIEFTYMPISFEAVEDFYLQYSSNGGSNWTTIKAYVNGVDFSDGVREYISITIDSGSYSFTSRAKLRFECSASSNSDDIYLDNVVISAFGGECNVFADFTCDGLVDVDDLLYMASVWLTNDGTADIAQPTRGIKGVRYLY